MSGFCFIREGFELKRTMLIILAILASMAIALKYFESNGPSTYASIFENIQELEQALSPYRVGQAPDDPALGTLGYTHALQWIVAKDGHQYTVYGYTFTDQETEEQYCNKRKRRLNAGAMRGKPTFISVARRQYGQKA